MTGVAITVDHVSKRFRIPLDRSATLKYRATHPRSTSRYRELLALDDVSFEVPGGQFLGITGPNGCGKSTLLKILSRIYVPDKGRTTLTGRVSPFLELGVGFNPELTARENIFLGGAVLGLSRKQLAPRVQTILEFAELVDFADQKLKNFSSGMGVRLAFSVAIQADADILLMDEVLAVGDARFQEKCFDVFSAYKKQGRTIVLVTHDLGSLNTYCDRVLLLRDGKLIDDGRPTEVTGHYRRIVGEMSDHASHLATAGASARWGSGDVEIIDVRLLNEAGDEHSTFATGRPMVVAVDLLSHSSAAESCVVGFAFNRSDGVNISGPNSKTAGFPVTLPPPGRTMTLTYTLPSLSLLSAGYTLTVAVYDEFLNNAYDHAEDLLTFRVVDETGRFGYVELGGLWSTKGADDPTADLSPPPDVAGVLPLAKNQRMDPVDPR
ncbi:MAG: ABC transporter ATP-binding protein [Candidatus Dormibacteraeota bacterium]|nr:ABC transporter ATP-binding protein [Candidatus Dormibacteraeota bacterium]